MNKKVLAQILLIFTMFNAEKVFGQHHVFDCAIADQLGQVIRWLPGLRCVFFEDGRFVSGTSEELAMYSKNMSKVWAKKISTHHQLTVARDGQRLLVMSHSVHPYKKKKVVFDKLILLDLLGNEIAAFDFFENHTKLLKLIGKKYKVALNLLKPSERIFPGVEYEFSHANTFREIPPNELEKLDKRFSAGNFLVNVNVLGLTLILDSKLREILWYEVRDPEQARHDTQMLENGRLLFLNNLYTKDSSAIEEYDPKSKKLSLVYKASGENKFFAPYVGGVQKLPNGNLLISDLVGGGRAFEVDKAGNHIWRFVFPGIDPQTGLPWAFFQIKRGDWTKFLKNNEGL